MLDAGAELIVDALNVGPTQGDNSPKSGTRVRVAFRREDLVPAPGETAEPAADHNEANGETGTP